ncbi:MAG: hypothetical protein JJ971_03650 [Balneolaceae bacterium]|nr:hypothetical protein [Balneolaceae bacterium]MBO6545467.1 hypothetical protein [Balneolaceae bacterium]MBO6646863.1 hypothetical protein [Balneolaceae bacterium]
MKKYLFLILILCSACSVSNSETESEELNLGDFKALVGESPNSGLYEELEGLAQFLLKSSDSTFNFILHSSLSSDTAATEVTLSMKSVNLPAEGAYSFNDIDAREEVFSDGFSGFYLSPTVGLGKQYYTESGTLTITRSESVNGIEGTFEAIIFYYAQVDSNEFVRQYSKMSGEFNAASMGFK